VSRAMTAVAAVVTLHLLSGHPAAVESSQATPAQSVTFSGTIAEHRPYRVGSRFSLSDGVWFSLREDRTKRRYTYLFQSPEDGVKKGLLEKDDKGEYQYAKLVGKRISGVATAHNELIYDVVSFEWNDGK